MVTPAAARPLVGGRPAVAPLATSAAIHQSGAAAQQSQHRFGIPETQPEIVRKFVNSMMKHGKKSTSQRVFNDALIEIKKMELDRVRADVEKARTKAESAADEGGALIHVAQEQIDPLKMFTDALEILMPVIGTTGIKRGGTSYQVPIALSAKRRSQLAIKWLIQACRERKGMPMSRKIGIEVLDALQLQGNAYGKKLALHKLAEANRAYANLR